MKQINDEHILDLNIWLDDEYGKKYKDTKPDDDTMRLIARECVDFLDQKGAARLAGRLTIRWVQNRGVVVEYGK